MTLRPPLSERTRRHVFARRAAIKPRMAAERPATPSLALRAWLTKAAVSARQPDPEHDRQASDLVFQTEPTLVRVDFVVVRFSDLLKRSPHTEGDDQANENRRNRRNRQNYRPEQCQTKMLRRVLVVGSSQGNPFRYFNSSPEVIHLVVMMYVRFPLVL
jgi:hypothetical protein